MNHEKCTHTSGSRVQSTFVLIVALACFVLRRLRRGCRGAAEIGPRWLERARQRRQLAELSDHMLRDIGVTRANAWAETDKPFWRP